MSDVQKQSDLIWKWPPAASKAHLFRRTEWTSLCGRWAFAGEQPDQSQSLGEKPGPDDCVMCHRRGVKILAKASESELWKS